jgi:ribosomal-protein-alanine N-acetyltransferase
MQINLKYFKDFPKLESERLRFRKLDIDDAPDIFFIRSNPQVMQFLDSAPHETVRDTVSHLKITHETYQKGEGIFWAIELKETGAMLGDFAFWRIVFRHCRAEIGYTLKPQFWGKGYMNEAMQTLVQFGFQKLNLHSLEANINPANELSRKLLLKTGFKKEGYFRESFQFKGQFLDSEIYSLLEKDFKMNS